VRTSRHWWTFGEGGGRWLSRQRRAEGLG
jgi:hypothetical protein